ncbi:hypothetical protein CC1G_14426 [Coprinopsis cinerea okayama7|uniref:HTH APSES-type domain-containing protein n=1 Tax=Coprinopsis cinerea (strain Okayama-7 / 130 / ATCC MYA-4618 / FGSC 9003) TaxID=240176 RepID=D6RMB0_COPC7|nr:hypothetical protein CC1G_14426 [Coprinopsis cinerea okayama7\|eukprot:XP_002911429.1 hypothetical protein CC1G_14426 [Coprinopsis cinerea okayama7\
MTARPPLPLRHANPSLRDGNATIPPVKYQILSCQGKDILVGRLKIDTTDGGHAFILRRFDTQAISLTTMFRAAFPTASEAEEKDEINYVKANFDLFGNNGSSKEPHITRLAGTWVNRDTAGQLAHDYNMVDLINTMVEAEPDPNGQYRRSNKSAQNNNPPTNAPEPTPATNVHATRSPAKQSPKPPSKTLPTPSPGSGDAQPPAPKRRREGSPATFTSGIPVASSPAVPKTPGPRRSTRTKSPAPSRVPQPLTATKPRSRASVAPPSPKKRPVDLPKSSPIKAEEDTAVEDNVAGNELYAQDISEQKKLIADLKAAASSKKPADTVKEDDDQQMEEEGQGPSKLKRIRQDEEKPLQFEFKEPEREERQIATNRRVGRFDMQPERKSLAWGIAAFAFGMTAITYLPNFL